MTNLTNTNLNQYQIKCQVQNTKKMYYHYLNMSKTNNSKFIAQWVVDYKNEHFELISMVNDKEWVEKYGVLNYFEGKYILN